MTAAADNLWRGGRRVVLKRLDDDCLLDGQLHPAIRQRLERVRELPVTCVANLLGVERIAGEAQLVWEWAAGTPLEQVHAADWQAVAREVVLAVEALHSAGIVHGAIHARNVVMDDAGAVRLTHVSPLLYDDPQQDADDVVAMLEELVAQREGDSPLARLLGEAMEDRVSLPELYARLGQADAQPPQESEEPREPRLRRHMILAALMVAVAGAGMAAAIYQYVTSAAQP